MFMSVAPLNAGATTAEASSSATLAPLAAAVAAAPADLLTKALRQELVNRWSGPNKAELQSRLDQNKMGAFDQILLDYMKARPGNTFYWNTSDVAAIQDFINAKLATSNTINNANSIVDHRFPNGNSEVYNVQLPAGPIDFSTTTSNVDFYYTL